MDKILLNQKEYHFAENDLPCLVHYAQGAGGSHFTVTMVADLFMNGSKILFLTAYPMARENLMQQIVGHEDSVVYATNKEALDHNKQAILIESGNQELFMEALHCLTDIQERVILIKNFEIFESATIQKALEYTKIIFSGDIDASAAKTVLLQKEYETIIQFSLSDTALVPKCPELPKYTGYLWQKDAVGLLTMVWRS